MSPVIEAAARRVAGPSLVVAAAAATLLLGIWQRWPCQAAGWPGDYSILMGRFCYSDIPLLYRTRVFHTGDFPYSVSPDYETLEYPVLTGMFADLAARVARWWHDGSSQDLIHVTFYEVNAVLLVVCGLLAVWATAKTAARPGHALMVATAPSLALTSLINWDLLAVALTGFAVWCWARSAPVWAGVFIGLGFAAKLYPVLLLGPLLLLCLRAGRLRGYGYTLAATAVTWVAVNLPVALASPQGWAWFWRFNQARPGEFGSVWYLFELGGHPVAELNLVSGALFGLVCLGVTVLALGAPRRPRLGQLGFLVLAGFLLVNKVYSPQYVLWLLPFVALARPNWRDWGIWQTAEVAYWAAIWMHIGGYLGTYGWLYHAATIGRVLATAYLAGMVVRDVLRPDRDPGRAADGDDPAGGVLRGLPDAPLRWVSGQLTVRPRQPRQSREYTGRADLASRYQPYQP
jgi:uncharacterized membrane protein